MVKRNESKAPLYIGGIVILIGMLVLLAKESLFIVIGFTALVLVVGFLFINRNKFSGRMIKGKDKIKTKQVLIVVLLLVGALLTLLGYLYLAVLIFLSTAIFAAVNDYRTVFVLLVLLWLTFVAIIVVAGVHTLWDGLSFPVEWSHTFGRGC